SPPSATPPAARNRFVPLRSPRSSLRLCSWIGQPVAGIAGLFPRRRAGAPVAPRQPMSPAFPRRLEPARVLYEARQIVFAVYAAQRHWIPPPAVQPDFGRHGELVAGAGDLALRPQVVITIRIAKCFDLSPDRALNPVPRLDYLIAQPLVAEAG